MRKQLYAVLFLIVSLIVMGATNSDHFIELLKQHLNNYQKAIPQEKAYLQTDKTLYKPGENIWYKVFLLNSISNAPSKISDVVDVDLKDPKGNVVESHKQSITNGTGEGDFCFLDNPDTPGGIYTLVAHTKWMKNFGEDTYFKKEVMVQRVITPRLLLKLDFEKRAYGAGDLVEAKLRVTDLHNHKTVGSKVKSSIRIGGEKVQELSNTTEDGETTIQFRLPDHLITTDGILQVLVDDHGVEESIIRSIPIVLNHIKLQFFPEGGDLVAGVSCKVAFEATNEFGKGADVSGVIIDQSGNQVAKFESYHLGMGAFEFTPKLGENYFARIIRPQINCVSLPLPQALESAYALHLNSINKRELPWNIYAPQAASVYFVAQTQGKIIYTQMLSLMQGVNKIVVPTDSFPAGVAVFTLFNAEHQPACERLVFLNEKKQLQIKIKTDKKNYTPNDIVNVDITTTDEQENPVAASLGVAVVDEQLLTLADDRQDQLLSYVWFSSELKGAIEEPSFYFKKEESKSKTAIDYLMLTHGWRRFTWIDILHDSYNKINFSREKENDIYGYVLDKTGKPTSAEVFLVETSGKKRVAKLTTTSQGYFVFHEVDLSSTVYVSTKLPNQVFIYQQKPHVRKDTIMEDHSEKSEIVNIELPAEPAKESTQESTNIIEQKELASVSKEYRTKNISNGDSPQLSSVVVISYGGGIQSDVIGHGAKISLNDALNNTYLQGISSYNTNLNPLMVIDGVPIQSTDLATAFSYINPEDISTIVAIKDATAVTMYGERAVNGVLSITTKNCSSVYRQRTKKPIYGGVILAHKEYYTSRSFYRNNNTSTTVYWNAHVTTNSKGKASFSFINGLVSSTFRITAEGVSDQGLIGSDQAPLVAQKPFSIDVKTPSFVGIYDTVEIPVYVKNNTTDTLCAYVGINMNNWFKFLNHPQSGVIVLQGVKADSVVGLMHKQDYNYSQKVMEVHVPPNQTQVVYFSMVSNNVESNLNFSIRALSGKYFDNLHRNITVRNVYFPHFLGFSGDDKIKNDTLCLKNVVPGSIKATAKCYTQFMDELFDGVASVLRAPHGCFEQVSSSTFPNIFALQFMNATHQGSDYSRRLALEYLRDGYNQLSAFEIKGGGFEWYGETPAHEALSAYGLLEFYEMKKVFGRVDTTMMNRTLHFILSRRDGLGHFYQNRGRYGFSAAPAVVNNAYIVYALTETQHTQEINLEYQTSLKEAWKSKDLYRMALMANAAKNMGDEINYEQLVDNFKTRVLKQGFNHINPQASIVYSYNGDLKRETTALWLMALLKSDKYRHDSFVLNCISFLNKGKVDGSFGNSQTTALCLQALSKCAAYQNKEKPKGLFNVKVNNILVGSFNMAHAYLKENVHCIDFDFSNDLHAENNTLQVSFSNQTTPYEVNVHWQSMLPAMSGSCPLVLSTQLAQPNLRVHETVRLSVTLKNTQNQGQPMSVAVVGIPAGTSLQLWQLKELQAKGIFDYYEIIDDNLVVYYRELGPHEVKTIHLDLKAELPGVYTGVASSAYLYYRDKDKFWEKGIHLKINE